MPRSFETVRGRSSGVARYEEAFLLLCGGGHRHNQDFISKSPMLWGTLPLKGCKNKKDHRVGLYVFVRADSSQPTMLRFAIIGRCPPGVKNKPSGKQLAMSYRNRKRPETDSVLAFTGGNRLQLLDRVLAAAIVGIGL